MDSPEPAPPEPQSPTGQPPRPGPPPEEPPKATTPWTEPAATAADKALPPTDTPQPSQPAAAPQPAPASQPERGGGEKAPGGAATEPPPAQPPKQAAERMEIPVENLAVGVVNALGDGLSAVLGAGKSVLGAGAAKISALSKRDKRELPSGTIPVEPLTNGIVSALGDGVSVVVEKGRSIGTFVASNVMDKAPAIATAGLDLFCEFAAGITDKLFGGKRNT